MTNKVGEQVKVSKQTGEVMLDEREIIELLEETEVVHITPTDNNSQLNITVDTNVLGLDNNAISNQIRNSILETFKDEIKDNKELAANLQTKAFFDRLVEEIAKVSQLESLTLPIKQAYGKRTGLTAPTYEAVALVASQIDEESYRVLNKDLEIEESEIEVYRNLKILLISLENIRQEELSFGTQKYHFDIEDERQIKEVKLITNTILTAINDKCTTEEVIDYINKLI